MMVVVPKIAAISYLNTVPFVYGIKHSPDFKAELTLHTPPEVVDMFKHGKADIALLSCATVPALSSYEIISNYCIGATGPVRTVVLLSSVPVQRIKRIWVDTHSRTSVQLCGYLAANKWRITPEWFELSSLDILQSPQETDAFLLIGDKVFPYENIFKYSYDLAEEWINYTHLPFTFAVWVARKGTPYEIYDQFEKALTFGIERTYEAIMESPFAEEEYAYDYLTKNIDYLFDAKKHQALAKFWDYGLKIKPKVQPG